MKHQLQTIREFIESAHEGEWASYVDRDAALTALSELERMAGEQEPVPVDVLCPDCGGNGLDCKDSNYRCTACEGAGFVVQHFFTSPPAHQPQYEAGDMASAHNDGFRAGVASVAQQPQARPDFTDEWTGYLKDGETPFERFLRERKDLNALTKLYQRALEENERLKGQHPQAEAVPPGYVLVPVEPTLEMGWAYLDAANAQDPLRHHVFNHDGYRAMIAAAQGEKP